jgi:hypothetical protein
MTPVLLSIAKEEAACRAAFAAAPKATSAWHVHHEVLAERLEFTPAERIAHILDKPKAERALRLRLFRPMSARDAAALASPLAAYVAARASAQAAYDAARASAQAAYDAALASPLAAYDAARASARAAYVAALASALASAHSAACPGCPWDGRSIFA